MRNLHFYISWLMVSLLIIGCAQVRSISGGEKDTTPPKLISAYPENESLQFTGNSFSLNFDEYVQLRDIQKELLVSPPLKTTPRVKVKQRSVEVSWDDTLRAASTYIFQFGKSIVDVNESNALNDLSYVFSTGKELDSLVCSGSVLDAYADKPAASTKVLLFDSTQHIFNASALPAYFARTNEIGEFRFNYLRSGSYTLCALSDENGNNHFDIGESVDWKENVTTHSIGDTLEQNLFLSTPRDTVIRSFDYLTDSSGVLKFRLAPWSPRVSVVSLEGDSIVQWILEDTLFATANELCGNRLDVAVVCGDKVVDTLSIQHLNDNVSMLRAKAYISPKMLPNQSVIIETPRPIQQRNDSLLKCYEDSVEIACSSVDITANRCRVSFERKPGASYSIQALRGWLTDDCNEVNDTLNLRFSCYDSKELGSLRFRFDANRIGQHYTFQLVDRTKKAIYSVDNLETTELVVNQLVPGDYTATLCVDANDNGYFDPMILAPFTPTERNYVYKTNIQVRANWEVVVDWTDYGP